MAPRRGGSSYGGGGSSSICPDAFIDSMSQVYFACPVVFLAVFLGISVATCVVRKKSGAGKKLISGPYFVALLIWLLSYALSVISYVLRECDVVSYDSFYGFNIAYVIFYCLAYWILLFVAGYVLNMMLRKQLGSPSKMIKIVLLAIMGLTFVFTCAVIGVTSYNNWTQTSAGYDAGAELVGEPANQLRVAYSVIFFLAVLATSALSVISAVSMRRKQPSGGSPLGLIIALAITMTIWILIEIIFSAAYLQMSWEIFSFTTQAVLTYLQNFFQALSFILLICIARHSSWNQGAAVDSSSHNQPVYYTYDANNAQNAYYHQAPEYVGQKP